MIRLYRRIEQLWFLYIPEKIRFLLVGGFNTLVSYFLFLGLSQIMSYYWALIITYFLAINLSIFTMRYYVFQSHVNFVQQYTKAWGTYLAMIIFNYIFLAVFVDWIQQPLWLAQGEYTILSTIGLYIVHKKVNFV